MHFCLIFSLPLECVGSKYSYSISGPHNLDFLDNVVFRAKRDTAQASPVPSVPSPSAQPSTLPTNSVATSNAAATATAPGATSASLPKVENPPRLLGVNGTGQRKDVSTMNGTKSVALPTSVPTLSPSQQPSVDNKSSTINKSLDAAQTNLNQSTETPVSEKEDKLIDEIDEPEEAINKTVNEHLLDEHLAKQLPKTDYFQYYNSTTTVDKNKSDEYWSQKKDYIVSSILSKSHRRAIVSGNFLKSFISGIQYANQLNSLTTKFVDFHTRFHGNLYYRRCN